MVMVDKKQKEEDELAMQALTHLKIAILEPQVHSAQIIRRSLTGIGITQTFLTRNSREMISMLQEQPMDILIAEWDSKPDSGLDVARYLRSPESPNQMIPIVLTTVRDSEEELAQARNAGVNEIVFKPFNMKSIVDSINKIVDDPKMFIVTGDYIGPDRRDEGPPPPGVEERRDPNVKPLIIHRSEINDNLEGSGPRIIEPDFELKSRLILAATNARGKSDEKVKKIEEDHVALMHQDIASMREQFKVMIQDRNHAKEKAAAIAETALSVRMRGIRSRYIFAARTSIALHDFCMKWFKPENPMHFTIIEKHLETLQAILAARITGDEHKVGRELVNELKLLVKKNI